MVKDINLENIDKVTKKAWDQNWKPHEAEELLEIFTYPRVKKQIELYVKYLPKKERILEGGCGLGPYLIYLRKLGYNIIGIDYNEEPVRRIKSYDNSLPVSVMDVKTLNFKDDSFAGYLSLGVIEHFPEGPEQAIKEAGRVLVRDGIFIVQVPVMNIFLAFKYPLELIKRNRWLRKLLKRPEKAYYWQKYFKAEELKAILRNQGFEVIEVVPMDCEHSVITFSSFFRDKESYDGANKLGLAVANFCEKCLPWQTAANMVLICKNKKNAV